MKGARNRIVSLALAILMLFSLISLSSCNRRYDEEEVLAVGKELLKASEMLNTVYYGSGIEYFDSEDEIGYYRKANPQHLEKLGFKTIEELKEITEKTFSSTLSNTVYSTVLSSLTTETLLVSPARYYQAYDEETGEPTHIMVYTNFAKLLKSNIEYNYDSLRVDGSKKENVYLSVDATVTNEDGISQVTTVTFSVIEEENGWRLNSTTYANYNSSKDRYDELKDKDIK